MLHDDDDPDHFMKTDHSDMSMNPQYMDRIRGLGEVLRDADPAEFSPDGRYSHTAQVISLGKTSYN